MLDAHTFLRSTHSSEHKRWSWDTIHNSPALDRLHHPLICRPVFEQIEETSKIYLDLPPAHSFRKMLNSDRDDQRTYQSLGSSINRTEA